LGHRRRRAEGIPLLLAKFRKNLQRRFSPERVETILALANDPSRLDAMSVCEFVDLLVE
jgi:2-methylcitrate dehydratase